jgi:hypothetical protein
MGRTQIFNPAKRATEEVKLSRHSEPVRSLLSKARNLEAGLVTLRSLSSLRDDDKNMPTLIYRSVDSGDLWARSPIDFLAVVERDGYNGPRFVFKNPAL